MRVTCRLTGPLVALVAVTCGPASEPTPESLAQALGGLRRTVPRFVGGYGHQKCGIDRDSLLGSTACKVAAFSSDRRTRLARFDRRLRTLDDRALGARLRGVLEIHRADDVESATVAIKRLEQASVLAPTDAGATNDLGAAYAVRAGLSGDASDLLRALDAISLAHALDPELAEAAFNRAWLFEQLALHQQASDAWKAARDAESDAPWRRAIEACLARIPCPDMVGQWQQEKQKLLAALRRGDLVAIQQVMEAHRREARLWAEDELLAAWARAKDGERVLEAAKIMEQARRVAGAIVTSGGDPFLAETVRTIDSAPDDELANLVEGHLLYGEGSQRAGVSYATADPLFRQAEHRLAKAGSPFALRAAFQSLRCAYQASDYEAVVRRGASLEVLVGERFPILAGRVAWVRGSALMGLGRTSAAAASFRRAVQRFGRAGERANVVAARSLLAGALAEGGDDDGARQERYRVLRMLAVTPDPKRLRLTLTDAAFDAAEQGWLDAALILQAEVVLLAEAQALPLAMASAHLHRAVMHERRGEREMARVDLTAAKAATTEIADADQQATLVASTLVAEGRMVAASDPRAALRLLDRGIAEHRARSFRIQLPGVLQVRAAAHRAAGHRAEAIADLEEAIILVERQRGYVWSPLDRIAFLDRRPSLYEDLISLRLDGDDPEHHALIVAERARARVMLDWLDRDPGAGPDGALPGFQGAAGIDEDIVQTVRQKLTDDAVVVVYEVLAHHVWAWVLRADDVTRYALPIARERLGALVEEAALGVARGDLEALEPLGALHRALIAPFERDLAGAESLAVVLDEVLHALPFNALYDATEERFLVEQVWLGVVPSLHGFVRLRGQAPARRSISEDLRLFVDPAVDSVRFPGLDPLVASRRGASEIQRSMPSAAIFVGPNATRAGFLAALAEATAIHVGAHAVADLRHPLRSFVALAPAEGRENGSVSARDVLAAPIGELELAVLSACRGAGVPGASREGPLGLVWALLARGVPQVIASPLVVEDQASGALFEAFYRHLAGGGAMRSLRRAQIERLGLDQTSGLRGLAFASFGGTGPGRERNVNQ